jgi:hypothetical protein
MANTDEWINKWFEDNDNVDFVCRLPMAYNQAQAQEWVDQHFGPNFTVMEAIPPEGIGRQGKRIWKVIAQG